MRFGAHASIAGGVANAPGNAAAMGCEVFQMFSRSPRGGVAPPITPEIAEAFKAAMKEHKQEACYIHTPYLINLASENPRTRAGSVMFIREDLERGSKLGATYVMTHIGSRKDRDAAEALDGVIKALSEVLEGYEGTTQLLLENAAGSGNVIGDTFEELAAILDHKLLKKQKAFAGICFDTQHAFAAGYDLRKKDTQKDVFDQFENIIGLERLRMFHANDSMVPFQANKDRHEALGYGEMGKETFKLLVQEPRIQHTDLIVETPREMAADVALLKSFRSKK